MYIEMNPTGLTLSELICVAHRKRSEDTGFPYAVLTAVMSAKASVLLKSAAVWRREYGRTPVPLPRF